MPDLGYYEGLRPAVALTVALSTVVLYLVYAAYLHLARPRIAASPSSLDLALLTVLGPVVGRAILGRVPTLAAGLVALVTLVLLRTATALVTRRADRSASGGRGWGAVPLVVAGRVDHDRLRRVGLTPVALWAALREQGVQDPAEVAVCVLERDGGYSVLRAGSAVHPDALTGVADAEAVLARLARGS